MQGNDSEGKFGGFRIQLLRDADADQGRTKSTRGSGGHRHDIDDVGHSSPGLTIHEPINQILCSMPQCFGFQNVQSN